MCSASCEGAAGGEKWPRYGEASIAGARAARLPRDVSDYLKSKHMHMHVNCPVRSSPRRLAALRQPLRHTRTGRVRLETLAPAAPFASPDRAIDHAAASHWLPTSLDR